MRRLAKGLVSLLTFALLLPPGTAEAARVIATVQASAPLGTGSAAAGARLLEVPGPHVQRRLHVEVPRHVLRARRERRLLVRRRRRGNALVLWNRSWSCPGRLDAAP